MMIPPLAASLIPPPIAAVVYAIGILGLFYLDRGENAQNSMALWIPAAWLLLVSSRSVALWLGMAPSTESASVYLEGNPIDRVVFTVLLLAALAVVITRIDKVQPLLGKNGLILLFLFYCAVSILWSDFPLVALKRWTKAVGDVAMILIIVTEPHPMRSLKRLLTHLGFLLFPLSLLLIKYFPIMGTSMSLSHFLESTGVTTHKNQLGLICMLYGLVFLSSFRAVYRRREDPKRGRRLIAYGTVILMIVRLLWLTNSMTSITGFAMAGGVMLLACRPALIPKRPVVHLLVLAVLGFSLFALFLDSAGGLLQQLGRNASLTGRTEVWSLVLNVPVNRWVGAGFESFWMGDRLVELRDALPNFPINESHNAYIEVLLNLGWVGVSLIILLLLTGYRKIIAMFRQDPDSGSLLLGFFLATIFESLTEAAYRTMTPAWIFFLLAIFAASRGISSESHAQIGSDQTGDLIENEVQAASAYT